MKYLKHLWIKKRMTLSFLLPVFLFCGIQKSLSQVGVNILTPHSSAAMQVQSPAGTFKGLLTPSMTTSDRINVTNSNQAADGLIVYDVDHRMHYYYNRATNRWNSMSPLTLSTSTSIGQPAYPTGVITTPSTSAGSFSLGINTQNPNQALHVVGNSTISGNSSVGGNMDITANTTVGGNTTLNGNLTVTGFPVNPLVPAGTIVMWTGGSIPAGWAECDGNNGTPDLRGRFIVAAGQSAATPAAGDVNHNYSVNQTGGKNEYYLSSSESGLPSHTHIADPHSHPYTDKSNTADANRGSLSGGAASATENTDPLTTTDTVVNINTNAAQNATSTHENRPQFYVLKFIMKQ